MKNLFMCYIVDPIAEKIIGSFQSPNEKYAKQLFSDFVNDDKNHVHQDVYMLISDVSFAVYETYSDILAYPSLGTIVDFSEVKNEDNSDSVKEN